MLRVVGIEVGEKAEVAAVNADHFDIVARQHARRAEHIAIAADHHGKVRLLSNLRQRASLGILKVELLRDLLLNNHLITFGRQPAPQHLMRGESGRVTRMAYNTNAVKVFVHLVGLSS